MFGLFGIMTKIVIGVLERCIYLTLMKLQCDCFHYLTVIFITENYLSNNLKLIITDLEADS